MKKFLLNAALLLLAATTATAAPTWADKIEKDLSSNVVTEPVHVVYSYELIANDDNTLTANLTIDGFQQVTGAVNPQFNYGHGFLTMDKTGDNSFTHTSSQTFEYGQSFNEFFFYLPFAGAANRADIPGYTYGASNEASTTEPSISARVENITTNSAEIAYEVSLPEGLEGAEVEVLLDGKATTESPILLEGLEAGRSYSHTLVARATLGGESVESKAAEVTFTTLPDLSKPRKWYARIEHTTEGSNIDLVYIIEYIANTDQTLTANITIENIEALPGNNLTPQLNIGDYYTMTRVDDNSFTFTTTKTFENGASLNEFIYLPYDGGADRIDGRHYTYHFGDVNEPIAEVLMPRLKAEAQNVLFDSAEIAYTVTLPAGLEGAEVKVTVDDVTATANPFVLSGLSENTEYSYSVVATATLDGESYSSKPVTVTFKTTLKDAVAVSYWQIADGLLEKAFKPGEDESARRNLPVSVKAEFVYNTNKTVTVNFTVAGSDDIVGFVPEINIDNDYTGALTNSKTDDGRYTYTTTKTFNEGYVIKCFAWIAFNGGIKRIDFADFTVGSEQAEVDWTEAASIEMSVGATILKTETPYTIDAFVRDTNGHYLPGIETALERGDKDEAQIDFNGMAVTAARKGRSTVKAYIPETNVSSELELNFNVTASSTNVVTREPQGNEQYTMLYEATENPENPQGVFLEDRGQQLIWNNFDDAKGAAGDYELLVDLGRYCVIHAVEIVWEGACAKEFTLNLHIRKDSPWYEGADRANAPRRAPASGSIDRSAIGAEPVFSHTVSDNALVAGGFVTNTAEVGGINARYISLKPTTAASTYGVKIAHLNVLGDENEFNADGTPTGVTDVTVDSSADATVDVYSLSGVCLRRSVGSADAAAGLAPGLYIIGSRKVMVK